MRSFTIKDKDQINYDIKVEIDTNHPCGFSDPMVVFNMEFKMDQLIFSLDELKGMISKIEKITRDIERKELEDK